MESKLQQFNFHLNYLPSIPMSQDVISFTNKNNFYSESYNPSSPDAETFLNPYLVIRRGILRLGFYDEALWDIVNGPTL